MNEIQLPLARTCLWCTKPLQGRADKKFCSSACKASYGRTATSTLNAMSVTTTSVPTTVHKISRAEVLETVQNDWQARCERAEEALHDSQQDFLLHQSYVNVASWFLRFENYTHTITGVDHMIEQAAEISEAYKEYSSLRIIGHVSHRRFTDLVFIHDCMYQVRERRLDGEQQLLGGLPWSGPNDIRLVWGLDTGQQNAMWQNLLSIA